MTITSVARLAAVPAALLLAALPVRANAFPDSAELHYVGPYSVPATMTFKRSGGSYTVVARINAPLYQMRFQSSGRVQGKHLLPLSYSDTRKGKTYAQASFNGQTVSYGRAGQPPQSATVKGPTFDLFTLAWELAMNDGRLPAGLHITNGKKLYPVSGIRQVGSGLYRVSGGDTPVNRYRVQRGNDSVEYAFAPELHNIPAQITYVDDGKTHTLKLKSIKINGKAVQPK